MTYPITIVDNFFEDPDGIVEQAMELRFYTPNSGNWPGTRTKSLHVEQPRFFSHFGQNYIYYIMNRFQSIGTYNVTFN